MPRYDPTTPPAGRLARLGVVVDPAAHSAPVVAQFCDLAGIDVVWVAGPEATSLAARVARARIGVTDPPMADLPPHIQEVTLVARRTTIDDARRWRGSIDRGTSAVRLSAAATSVGDFGPLLGLVDDVVLTGWHFPDLETAADEARAEAAEAGRDPATLGVAAVVPVSIGRTEAEAAVRADVDPQFRSIGHPRDIGIFGTLEECQDRVIALAHAGITDLRCLLPEAPDVHDVIAQLTAVAIGTTDVLVPGSLRSPAPAPPEGWGGRPDKPPRPQVSGGSRRR